MHLQGGLQQRWRPPCWCVLVAGELGAAGKHLEEAAEDDVHQAEREASEDVDEHQVCHKGSGRAAPLTGLPVDRGPCCGILLPQSGFTGSSLICRP